jgi:AraC-like DNA-binding protein
MLPIYSTEQSNTALRAMQWRDVINDTFFRISCDAERGGTGFDGAIARLPLGASELYAIGSDAVHYVREERDAERDGHDSCQVLMVLEGSVGVTQHGRQTLLEEGQMCMWATRDPLRLDMPQRYRSLLWSMPRAAMPSLPHPERFTARTLGTRSGIPRLISQLMRDTSLLDAATEGPALARLGMPMAELVGLALEAEFAGISGTPSRNGQLLERIKARLMENLETFDVDVNRIADDLGVGIRTLNRMFAAEGTTAMQWLLRQRLRNSYRLLSEGRIERVSDAAISSGFNNLSHFSRAFRREFGMRPNSLLRKDRPQI